MLSVQKRHQGPHLPDGSIAQPIDLLHAIALALVGDEVHLKPKDHKKAVVLEAIGTPSGARFLDE